MRTILFAFIIFFCLAVSCSPQEQVQIISIYEWDANSSILFDTEKNTGNILIHDDNSLFIILQESADRKWITVEKTPSDAGGGRVETEILLFHVPGRSQIDISSIDPSLSPYPLFIETQDKRDYLVVQLVPDSQAAEASDNDEIYIDIIDATPESLEKNIKESLEELIAR